MANAGFATLTIIPSAKNFASKLRSETGSAMGAVGKESGGKASKGFGGAFIGGLKPMLAGLGGIFAIDAAAGMFKGAINEASSLKESVNALNVVYGKQSEGIQKLGKSAAQNLGLSNVEFNSLAVRFSNFAKTIAGSEGNVTGTLKGITTRAADFASVMNLDVAKAAELFQSGLAGETEPLRQFGINLSAAATKAHAYETGIAKAGEELTANQKVQARYSLLMEKTAKTQGDFNNTQNSFENIQRRIGSQWSNLTAKMGAGFLPILEKILKFVNGTVLPGLSNFGKTVKGIFSDLGGGGKGGLGGLISSLRPLARIITGQVLPAMLQFGKAIMSGVKPVLDTIGDIIMNSVVPALRDMAAMAKPLVTKVAQTFRVLAQTVGPILNGIATVIRNVWGFIGPFVIGLVKSIFQNVVNVFTGLLDVIQGVVRLVSAIFRGDWAAAWDAVKQIVLGAVKAVWNFIQLWLIGRAVKLIGAGLKMVKGLFSRIWNGIVSFFKTIARRIVLSVRLMIRRVKRWWRTGLSAVKGFFSRIWNGIVSFFKTIVRRIIAAVVSFITRAKSRITSGLSIIKSTFSRIWNGIVSFFTGVVGRIVAHVRGFILKTKARISAGLTLVKSIFSRAWDRVLSLVKTAFSNIVSTVKTGVSNVMDFIKGLPGKITAALGSLGTLLIGAGEAILEGFLDGLTNAWGAVTDFVGGIGDWIAENKGPLPYDRRLLIPAGKAIMEGLGRGLEGELGSLKDTLGRITRSVVTEVESGVRKGSKRIQSASVGLVPKAPSVPLPVLGGAGGSNSGAGAGAGGAGTQITLNGIEGDPEAFADALTFAMRRARRGGVYGPGGTE